MKHTISVITSSQGSRGYTRGWCWAGKDGSSAHRSSNQHCTEVRKYVDNLVYARIQQDRAKKTSDTSKGKFVLLNELAKHSHYPIQLRNDTLHVLSASWDTISALLGWFFYFLARNRRVFEKLRHVVLADFASDIDFRKSNNCRYLEHCINETFHVAAIIPVIEPQPRHYTAPRTWTRW